MDTFATPTFKRLGPSQTDAARENAVVPHSDAANKDRVSATTERFTLTLNYVYNSLPGTQGPTYEIAGEPFRMDKKEDGFVLWHDYLPFRGEGATLLEAEQRLIEDARNLMPLEWEAHPIWLERRDFILKVM